MKQYNNPPIAKNQPPIAGAINWCRLLFHRIKKPILKFQTLPEMLDKDIGKVVKMDYLQVARAIRDYELKVILSLTSKYVYY